MSSQLFYLFVPNPKGNTIVFIILKGEPIPKDQKAVVSSTIAVEDLLPRVCLLRSRYNEMAVVLFIPPVKLHPCFELSIHQRFRLAEGLLAAFIDEGEHLAEELLFAEETGDLESPLRFLWVFVVAGV